MLNTDIVYLNGSSHHNREWIPDGFYSTLPPKKVGRNREKDQLLMQMHFQNGDVGEDEYSSYIELASQYFYGTAGSITAASRAAINAVNQQLLETNRTGGFSPPLQAGITCAILRGDDLYVTQSGPGGVVVFRESNFEQFPDNNVSARAVGMSDQTVAHYFHTVIAHGDLLWMSCNGSSDWDFTSLLRKTGDLHHYLANLRVLTRNDAPSMLCRFCESEELGQLYAALSAIEHVDSVSGSDADDLCKSEIEIRTDSIKAPIWESSTLSAIDDDPGGAIANSYNGASDTKPLDLSESYPVSDMNTDVSNSSESEVVFEDTNASSWASDILSAIDEHETGAPPSTDAKVLPESFEQPTSEIHHKHVNQESETSNLLNTRLNSESFIDTKDTELEHDYTNLNYVTKEDSNVSDGLYVQSEDDANELTELTIGPDNDILDLSSDLLEPVFIEPEQNRDQQENQQGNNDFVNTLDVDMESDWNAPKKRNIGFTIATLQTRIEAQLNSTVQLWSGAIHKIVSRILPDYDHDVQVPGSALLWGAAGVPVLVVVLTIAVYVQFGRSREFNYYIDQARMEATLGRASSDAIQAAPHWRQVLLWSSLAHEIRSNHPDVEALETAAIGFLDVIDRVERVDVELITLDGLQPNANISKILARGSSVYLLDLTNQLVNRAVLTTSGQYQLDPVFECRNGEIGAQSINSLVDIAWLDSPNVVGQDTLIALDPDGRLLYCTSDGTMAVTLLAPPYDGWNNPVALEAFQGRIYVMEPEANEVWVYTRDDKFFVQAPERYFSESAIDLSDAIDISIVQGSIYILHEDGHMTECVRKSQDLPPECNLEMTYIDGRLGGTNDIQFENVSFPVSMAAYPPPYSSLYLTDAKSPGVFQFSLRLAYQREFRAVSSNGEVEAIGFAVGPGRHLFFASKDSLYVGKRP